MTSAERKQVARLQDLAGQAKGIYLNDRGERAERLIPVLDEMFQVSVALLARYPPQEVR